MAKDPATLWYWNDWHSGTVTFSRHLKGCYMDLLHAQFNNGRLSLDAIKTVLGTDFSVWNTLQKKFRVDENGLYYNERAELEKEKRQKFSESRRNNLKAKPKKPPHMGTHMEDVNENGNSNSVFINPKEYLKLKSGIALDEISMKSGFSETDFDFHFTQWSLKAVEAGWEYSGIVDKDCKRLLAGLEKWINTCSRNQKNNTYGNTKNTPVKKIGRIDTATANDFLNRRNNQRDPQADIGSQGEAENRTDSKRA